MYIVGNHFVIPLSIIIAGHKTANRDIMDLAEVQMNIMICFKNFKWSDLLLEHSLGGVLKKDCHEKFRKNYLRTPVPKFFFLSRLSLREAERPT